MVLISIFFVCRVAYNLAKAMRLEVSFMEFPKSGSL